MEAARHLHLVDTASGEATQACSGCQALLEKVSSLKRENTLLKNAEEERTSLTLDSKPVMEVLQFHKRLFGGQIFKGKAAWKAVQKILQLTDAETGEPAFTVLHLNAASVGLSLSRWHREHRKTGAAFLFADPDRVQEFIATCVEFKRETGTSALEIVDALMGPGLAKLAARCGDCGHTRLDHERDHPELDLWTPPCSVHGCACGGWDDSNYRAELFLRAQDERTMAQ